MYVSSCVRNVYIHFEINSPEVKELVNIETFPIKNFVIKSWTKLVLEVWVAQDDESGKVWNLMNCERLKQAKEISSDPVLDDEASAHEYK